MIAPMRPYPFATMMSRIAHELDSRGTIFDLPSSAWWREDPKVDLSGTFLGRPIGTPLGPAAGPHTQLAHNLVLGWLAGARVFELKTVQAMDELALNRPCIDMGTLGFNAEWSQELHVPEALEEYVKGWMAIHLLRQWDPLQGLLGDRGQHMVFNMSLGYELRGITSAKVGGLVDVMRAAHTHINRLRREITAPFAPWRDIDVDPCVSDTVTLSTFHGCPPRQIGEIAQHLMERHGLDVVIKLNPTLLGYKRVDEVLHGCLGYDDIVLVREAFRDDLGFDAAAELIEDLRQFASRRGRRFGVKLTNNLVVENQHSPIGEDLVFLSGAPLHALATALFVELLNTLPGVLAVGGHEGDVEVTFSGGVDANNLSETLGMGAESVTMCSALLEPGGYARMAPMLTKLGRSLQEAGVSDVAAWRNRSRALAQVAGFRGPVEAHLDAVLSDAATGHRRAVTDTVPEGIDAPVLRMFGCLDCNVCVTFAQTTQCSVLTQRSGPIYPGRISISCWRSYVTTAVTASRSVRRPVIRRSSSRGCSWIVRGLRWRPDKPS